MVAPVHVGTGFEQGGDDVCVATNGREMERCVLVHVRRINIRSRFEEHMYAGDLSFRVVASGAQMVERSPATRT